MPGKLGQTDLNFRTSFANIGPTFTATFAHTGPGDPATPLEIRLGYPGRPNDLVSPFETARGYGHSILLAARRTSGSDGALTVQLYGQFEGDLDTYWVAVDSPKNIGHLDGIATWDKLPFGVYRLAVVLTGTSTWQLIESHTND
jgi:hypothetical protein